MSGLGKAAWWDLLVELGKAQVTPLPLSTRELSLYNAAPVTVTDSSQRKSDVWGAGKAWRWECAVFSAGGRGFSFGDSEERGSWVRTGGKFQISAVSFSTLVLSLPFIYREVWELGTGEHPWHQCGHCHTLPSPLSWLVPGGQIKNKEQRVCLPLHLRLHTGAMTNRTPISRH